MRDSSSIISIPLKGDGEIVKWDPFNEHSLAVSDENGNLYLIDDRSTGVVVHMEEAHSKSIPSIDFHPLFPGLLLTCSFDKHLKIWDTLSSPSLIFDRKLGVGQLLASSFCRNNPFLVAYTGSKSQDPQILNLSNRKSCKSDLGFEKIRQIFEQRLNLISSK